MQIQQETSVTNCNDKHGLMLTCRHLHVRPHCCVLSETCSCRLELAYFVGKISKNRLVCKNAIVVANYGSYRILVMASCPSVSSHYQIASTVKVAVWNHESQSSGSTVNFDNVMRQFIINKRTDA